MSPPLDLESLRRQYPDMPGWGERVFVELEAVKSQVAKAMEKAAAWSAADVVKVCGAVGAVVVALKGGGVL